MKIQRSHLRLLRLHNNSDGILNRIPEKMLHFSLPPKNYRKSVNENETENRKTRVPLIKNNENKSLKRFASKHRPCGLTRHRPTLVVHRHSATEHYTAKRHHYLYQDQSHQTSDTCAKYQHFNNAFKHRSSS